MQEYFVQEEAGIDAVTVLAKPEQVQDGLASRIADYFLFHKQAVFPGGEITPVPKIRTMRKGAEDELNDVIALYGKNHLGQVNDDPRVTWLGRILRAYHIDELPQLLLFMQGKMSLVGIRPRSNADWGYYPADLKKRALLYVPGLLPPSYAHTDLSGEKDHIRCEYEFLDAMDKDPLRTQVVYFCRIMYNLTFRQMRGY